MPSRDTQTTVARLFTERSNLYLLGMAFGLIELVLVLLPSWATFDLTAFADSYSIRFGLLIAAIVVVITAVIHAHWYSPMIAIARAKARGEQIDEDTARRGFRWSLRLPMRGFLIRSFAWIIWAGVVGVMFVSRGRWTEVRAVSFIAVVGIYAFAASSLRSIAMSWLLTAARREWFERDIVASFTAVSWRAFGLIAIWIASGVLVAQLTFAFYFVPMSEDKFLASQAMLLLFVLLAAAAWGLLANVHANSLHQFAAKLLTGDTSRREAISFYRDAQWLPYQLGRNTVLLWVIAIFLSLLINRTRLEMPLDNAIVIAVAQFMIVLGGILYELILYRGTLSALVVRILARAKVALREVPPSLSLPAKLLYTFGGVLVLACGMATVWGFSQYKWLATESIGKESTLGVQWIRSSVQAELVASKEPPTPEKAWRVVANLVGASSADVVYFIDDVSQPMSPRFEPGTDLPVASSHWVVGNRKAVYGYSINRERTDVEEKIPRLPWYVIAGLRGNGDQRFTLPQLGLDGRGGRLIVRWNNHVYDVGAVALFYPSYYGRGGLPVRPLKQLFVFFVVLLVVCGGVIILSISQFATNVRALQRRASEMARGALSEPMIATGEGDEIGSLTVALEDMRRALRDRIQLTEEMNANLEKTVQNRTADLAKKNKELAETLDKLARSQKQLVRSEKLASIGQLVAGIAHEINNPVNAMVNTVAPIEEAIEELAYAKEASRESSLEELRDMLRVMQRGAQRTKAIVTALRNYSRNDDDNVGEFDINRLIEDSLSLLGHLVRGHIDVEKQYGEIGKISGHAGQVGQVFMNLLTNAAQAVHGMDNAKVTIRTSGTPDSVTIYVADNGPGIPKDVLPRIWDPFFTTKEVGEGTGLGLSITYELVERHGGTIEVETEVGAGTSFTIVLPRTRGHISKLIPTVEA